ncbi:hypothetical protein HAX54_004687, partial [Datura stramonium]|nr:hypothetical protein [Datura stramonium]
TMKDKKSTPFVNVFSDTFMLSDAQDSDKVSPRPPSLGLCLASQQYCLIKQLLSLKVYKIFKQAHLKWQFKEDS